MHCHFDGPSRSRSNHMERMDPRQGFARAGTTRAGLAANAPRRRARASLAHQLVTRWSSLVAVDVTPTRPVDTELDTREGPSLLPKGWNWRKIFGDAAPSTGQTGPDHKTNGTTPPAVPRAAIGQRIASAQIGRLPQGGTPTALLFLLGTSLLSMAGAASYIHKRSL